MEFYNLNKDTIRAKSTLVGDYYVFNIGNRIEVTSMKKKDSNNILSNCLSSTKKEDKLMIKYFPSNIIYFDKDFINEDDSDLCSCSIDVSTCSVYIGRENKYNIQFGVLAFSGILSANNLVESMRYVYCNSQLSDKSTKSKVNILSVGVLNDKLFGLFFLSKERGLAISSDSSLDLSYSVKTWKLQDYSSWNKYCIEDWFQGSKITLVD